MPEEAGAVGNKVCLITGGTRGIGLATAMGLAQQGATVILVGRDLERGEAAVKRVRAEAKGGAAEFLSADLSVRAEVRRLARGVAASYSHVDVLINSAGGFFHRRQESTDGVEMTWALNVLAPFLLTTLLLPALQASAPSRIINITSFTQRFGRVRFDDPEGRRWYLQVQAYAQSKRAVLLLTSELARRLTGGGITANAADPGFVATGIISSNAGPRWKPIQRVLNLAARLPEEGARLLLYLAASPEVQGVSGLCFTGEELARSKPASRDEADARRLWQLCATMTRGAGTGGQAGAC
jgi:NAD(P)-dependent dehydrogenase (short-subunit alcohol dehydrogenase family)